MPTLEVPPPEAVKKAEPHLGEKDPEVLKQYAALQSQDADAMLKAYDFFTKTYSNEINRVINSRFRNIQQADRDVMITQALQHFLKKLRAGEVDVEKSTVKNFAGRVAHVVGKNKRADIMRHTTRTKTLQIGVGKKGLGDVPGFWKVRKVASSTEGLTPEEKILGKELTDYLAGIEAGEEPFPWRIRLKGKILTPDEMERVKSGLKPDEYNEIRKAVENRMVDMFMCMYGFRCPKKTAGDIEKELGLTRHAQRDINNRMKGALRAWVGKNVSRLKSAGVEDPVKAYELFLVKLTNLLSGPSGYKIVERKSSFGRFLQIVNELDVVGSGGVC